GSLMRPLSTHSTPARTSRRSAVDQHDQRFAFSEIPAVGSDARRTEMNARRPLFFELAVARVRQPLSQLVGSMCRHKSPPPLATSATCKSESDCRLDKQRCVSAFLEQPDEGE